MVRERGRGKYSGDYERDSSGEYRYKGERYRSKASPGLRALCAMEAAALAAAFVLAGLMDNAASRIVYIALPYAASALPIAFIAADVFKILLHRSDLTRRQYDGSVGQLGKAAPAALLMSVIAAAGDTVFLLTRLPSRGRTEEFLFLALCAVMAALSGHLTALQRRIRDAYKRVPPEL
ncbi:MAG: hypothetical protein GX549_04490 [Clostridiales bacterium]|nr:hypothetical protein [Clostridiales bacterium]